MYTTKGKELNSHGFSCEIESYNSSIWGTTTKYRRIYEMYLKHKLFGCNLYQKSIQKFFILIVISEGNGEMSGLLLKINSKNKREWNFISTYNKYLNV